MLPHVPALLYKSREQNQSAVVGSHEAPSTVMAVPRSVSWAVGPAGPLLASARQGGPLRFGSGPGSGSSVSVLAHEGHDAGWGACLGEERVLQQLGSSGPLGWVAHQQAVQEALQRW